MVDKNAGIYPLKNFFFENRFSSQVSVDLGHNNMSLAKLISKIRK